MMAITGSSIKLLLLSPLLVALTNVLVHAAPAFPFPSQDRLVVAHFMVGNTYPYTLDDWAEDIILAASKGIDGFALNIGRDPWEPARVHDAFYIASQLMKDPGTTSSSVVSVSSASHYVSSVSATSTPKTSSAITHPVTSTHGSITTKAASSCTKKDKQSLPTPVLEELVPRADDVPPWSFPYGTNHTNFHLFLSFDMASLSCGSLSDAEPLRNLIRTYRRHPRYLRYGGKMLVSTFAGEWCTFGQGNAIEGWKRALDFELRDDIHFVPSFFVTDGSDLEKWSDVVNGDFYWEGAWPKGNNSIDALLDYEHLRYNYGKIYMAGVSPWFFTHYGPDTYNKNWVLHSDDWLAVQRWELMVANRVYIDIAQIISWNDYGESHYVGPVHGAQPNSQSWVDGFDHTAWLDMMQYYIEAYKTGTYPNITKDQIFLWGRLFPRDAVATSDPVGRPQHFDWTEDIIWSLVFLTQPSHTTISCNPFMVSAYLPAGAHKIKLDITPKLGESFIGCQVTASIQRNEQNVGFYAPLGFTWRNISRVEKYNFNAFVAASP